MSDSKGSAVALERGNAHLFFVLYFLFFPIKPDCK